MKESNLSKRGITSLKGISEINKIKSPGSIERLDLSYNEIALYNLGIFLA